MLQYGGINGKSRLVEKDVVDKRFAFFPAFFKSVDGAKPRPDQMVLMHFHHFDGDGLTIVVHKVPRKPRQLALDIGDEVCGPVQGERLPAPEDNAQQMVETDEMVDMRVADKNMGDLEQVHIGHGGQIAQIKQQRAPLMKELYQNPGVAQNAVYQAGMK